MRFVFFLFVVLVVPSLVVAAPVEGYWRTQDGDAIVSIYKCDLAYCGRFIWLKDDSAQQPSLDDKNKDEDKRSRPLCGLTFIGGFEEAGAGKYDGGWIYSPRHGHNFSAALFLTNDNTLELRGYVFVPFFGGSQTWSRVQNPDICWALALTPHSP